MPAGGVVFEAVPNFSEGRRPEVLARLERALGPSGCLVLDVDPDAEHDRSVISVVSNSASSLVDGLSSAVSVAVERIDLRQHAGLHPRVGAADVVPLVPLGAAGLDACVEAAWELGSRIWAELGVPVYWYGAAARRDEARRLVGIRSGRVGPDLGSRPHPSAGVVCVGARPPLVAYNVVLSREGVDVGEARALAVRLRESAGGLAGVQALLFELADGSLQLSFNLTDLQAISPASLLTELRRLGVEVRSEQVVGLCPARAAVGSAAAAGRVLEARLGSAVAVEAYRACLRRAGDEDSLLGERLLALAGQLRSIGSRPEELLAGAEQVAGLSRVLEAAGLLTEPRRAFLGVAARGLRSALGDEVGRRHPQRVELLDRWLGGG